jgi:hypothetical protein
MNTTDYHTATRRNAVYARNKSLFPKWARVKKLYAHSLGYNFSLFGKYAHLLKEKFIDGCIVDENDKPIPS